MKIIIMEATAEELKANKRVADAVMDALTNFADSIVRSKPDEEVTVDE